MIIKATYTLKYFHLPLFILDKYIKDLELKSKNIPIMIATIPIPNHLFSKKDIKTLPLHKPIKDVTITYIISPEVLRVEEHILRIDINGSSIAKVRINPTASFITNGSFEYKLASCLAKITMRIPIAKASNIVIFKLS